MLKIPIEQCLQQALTLAAIIDAPSESVAPFASNCANTAPTPDLIPPTWANTLKVNNATDPQNPVAKTLAITGVDESL